MCIRCARLPYGVIVHRYSDNCDISIDNVGDFAHFLEYSEGEEFKPYLSPLSSMTEEERQEYGLVLCDELSTNQYDWLNSHHFDYRGLIKKGWHWKHQRVCIKQNRL